MGLDPLKATEAVVSKYLDYLETTFSFNDMDLHRQLAGELRKSAKFVKGPILEATPPFQSGNSMEHLIQQGILSLEFNKLQTSELPLDRDLYMHQEIAIRKLIEDRRNLIVATGTGSGKTETFLVPILNHLFRQKEQGKLGPGIRALLLYPMNALANDQLNRLRKLLKNYPDITFGSYTGETERTEKRAVERFKRMNPREDLLPNELLSRQAMKQSPPHILLTNYAMLEFLLLRPDDHVFFDGRYAQDWRFIVMDEVHIYSGAKGIEIAMLLRRLKDRVAESRLGALQYIGTSATLVGNNQKDFKRVARFGEVLFGEEFEWEANDPARQDIVVGHKKRLTVQQNSWGKPHSKFYLKWMEIINEKEDTYKISRLTREGQALGVPKRILETAQDSCNGKWTGFVYKVLYGDSRVIALQKMLEEQPCFIHDAAEKLFPGNSDSRKYLVALVELANSAKMGVGDQPLIPARYHLLIRTLEGGYISLLPKKQLYLERREWVNGSGGVEYPVFEAATCSQCSSLYLVGETEQNQDGMVLKQPGKGFFEDSNNLHYFLLRENNQPVPENEDEIVMAGHDTLPSEEEYLLCGKCGAIKAANDIRELCKCGKKYSFSVIRSPSKKGNVHKCPACGSINPLGSMVRRFMLGAEAVTSVLATALYQQIPEQVETPEPEQVEEDDDWGSPNNKKIAKSNRRLLIFSDSRQDAAFFSTYLEASYNQILQRRLIIMTLEKYRDKVLANRWGVKDLADFLKRMMYELELFPELSLQELEKEAWKWVLREFMFHDRAIGLEGQGLLGFQPELPFHWVPPRALRKAPWNFTQQEATQLMMVLLDNVRKNGAIRFPDVVDPRDSFFAPRNREYYFKEDMAVSGRIYSWNPVSNRGNNSRLDYLLRLASAKEHEIDREKVKEFLANIWSRLLVGTDAAWNNHFSSHHESQNYGEVYCLRPEYWRLVPSVIDNSTIWYRCNKCRRLSLYNIWGVCPTYRCNGQLLECDPSKELADNHYRKLYLDILPMGMRTSEHTAQLTTIKAGEIQKQFYDGEVNVLSCSTTFELGVDVGELQTVFMRNVPPTAANYVQRAGRAGRRASSTAFALTFAQRRSHDFSHFAQPLQIINGKIKPPHVEIRNQKIIKRHMYAVALAMFWELNSEYFGQVKDFFSWPGKSATPELRMFLQRKPDGLKSSLKRIVPQAMWEQIGIENWNWVEEFLGEQDGVLSKAETQLMADLRELRAIEQEHSSAGEYRKAAAIQKTINTLEKRDIISFLSKRNVIPKYGFPVDVVELQIYHHGEEAKGLELDRDLKQALSEYAPESQVVAGGKLWTSNYIKKLPDREPIKYDYAICNYCGYYKSDIADKHTDMDICICGERIGKHRGTFITPEFGFISGQPQKPTMSKPQKTYTTRKYFAREGRIEQEVDLALDGINLNMQAGDGRLAVVNSAGGRGFMICQSCGYAEVNRGTFPGEHKNTWGKDCRGRFVRYSLGYEFTTDILRLRFPWYHDRREGFWESLLYGLLEGACSALEIERQDVDGTLYSYVGDPNSPALVLFDDVPGGAGHVKRIAEEDNFMDVLRRTLEIVSRCECGGEQGNTSCYGCLRSYTNQYCHDRLKRGYVLEFVSKMLQESY